MGALPGASDALAETPEPRARDSAREISRETSMSTAPATSVVTDIEPLLELFSSYPQESQRAALDTIARVYATLTVSERTVAPVAQSSRLSAVAPTKLQDELQSSGNPGAVKMLATKRLSSTRLAALEELALTLSDEEAGVLTSAIQARCQHR